MMNTKHIKQIKVLRRWWYMSSEIYKVQLKGSEVLSEAQSLSKYQLTSTLAR
jgi:hypothetical protein